VVVWLKYICSGLYSCSVGLGRDTPRTDPYIVGRKNSNGYQKRDQWESETVAAVARGVGLKLSFAHTGKDLCRPCIPAGTKYWYWYLVTGTYRNIEHPETFNKSLRHI
jgi:hypothetical protein